MRTGKRLHDAQRLIGEEDVNDIVDEMILRAFKIITKGVRFLDILEDDRRSRVPAVTVMPTLLEEARIPLTPPADPPSLETADAHAGSHMDGFDARSSSTRLPSGFPQQSTNAHRVSQNSLLQTNRLSSTISHRISLVGLSSCSLSHNLISERLNTTQDIFLSQLGSLIGRLQLQSQMRPSLVVDIKQFATSGGELLWVVDVVCAHTSIRIGTLEPVRAAMYHRILDLVHTARDILSNSGPEMEDDIIVLHDNGRLLEAATGCVKVMADCVTKTRWVIERIGDFEFKFEHGSLVIDFGLSDLVSIPEEEIRPGGAGLPSIAELTLSETPTVSISSSVAASVASSEANSDVSHARSLSIDKPLPEVPQFSYRVSEQPSVVSSVSSLRPDLPPLHKISTTSLRSENYNPTEPSSMREGEFHSFRSDCMTTFSAGSSSTYLSRDSESSIVSQSSTRATTPEFAQALKIQPSLSNLSISESFATTEDDDLESKVLEKTYAHELIFNKEGQVAGGSLPALVERLTTHESTPDALFVSTFYLTFRLFCTPVTLTEALIHRFDYVGEAPHIAAPVRLRTYNVFKGWLESHWRDETD